MLAISREFNIQVIPHIVQIDYVKYFVKKFSKICIPCTYVSDEVLRSLINFTEVHIYLTNYNILRTLYSSVQTKYILKQFLKLINSILSRICLIVYA